MGKQEGGKEEECVSERKRREEVRQGEHLALETLSSGKVRATLTRERGQRITQLLLQLRNI
jgi:hypothetical protein